MGVLSGCAITTSGNCITARCYLHLHIFQSLELVKRIKRSIRCSRRFKLTGNKTIQIKLIILTNLINIKRSSAKRAFKSTKESRGQHVLGKAASYSDSAALVKTCSCSRTAPKDQGSLLLTGYKENYRGILIQKFPAAVNSSCF